jgi:small subunit ribosomal protein S3
MGQKVNPIGFRLPVTRDWGSRWFTSNKHEFKEKLLQDIAIRTFLKKKFKKAGVSRIKIERLAQNAQVIMMVARPGMIIGKKGNEVDELKREVTKLMGVPTNIDIQEVRRPEIDAQLVSEAIAEQLEKRVMFRRAMKRAAGSAERVSGVIGIRIQVSGRLGGAEIARSESYRSGSVPLHTLRTQISYGVAEAKTTYGILGVKVWIATDPSQMKNQESNTEGKKPHRSSPKSGKGRE